LAYLLVRTRELQGDDPAQTSPQAAAGAVTLYWHFMDGLWIYLFLLLFFWR
jgi:heme/copper-type cytochrome/quinol oxidase subunit 3